MEISAMHCNIKQSAILVILQSLITLSYEACSTVQAPFPKMFGGPFQQSYFDQIDYNTVTDYLVGVGSTQDLALSGTSFAVTHWRPVIIAYDSSFEYLWGKVFDRHDSFSGVKINRVGTKVVASTKVNINRCLIIFNIANGNIESTTQLTTINFDNKFERKILLLDTGQIMLGDDRYIYKINPSSPTTSRLYSTSSAGYKTIGLQLSSGEFYMHIFQFDAMQSKCLISLVLTAQLTRIHQNEVQCTSLDLVENFQMGYYRKTINLDQIAFQIGSKYFRIKTVYLGSYSYTASMMEDPANPNLQAKGLFCANLDIFYSLMYGSYLSDSNRIFIAEVNFVTITIIYRRYLQTATDVYFGVIYEHDKSFIAAYGTDIQTTSSTYFHIQPVGQGIIYSPIQSCQDIEIFTYPIVWATIPLTFASASFPFSQASLTLVASISPITSVAIVKNVFEGIYSTECSIIAALPSSYEYTNLAATQTLTTVYFVIEEISKVIRIDPFTADIITSGTPIPVYTYSLKSFAGPPNAVVVNSLTGALTIDTNLFGVGEYNVVVDGKLQDCQRKKATLTLICEDNIAPEFTGVTGNNLQILVLTQEEIQVSTFPIVLDPNPGQLITVNLINAPSFVDFTDILHTAIMIEPTLRDPPGLYTITITIFDGFATTSYTLDIQVYPSPALQGTRKIVNKGPPYFTSALDKITLQQGDMSSYTLPQITDPDGDKIIMKVALGEAVMFMEYSNNIFTYNIQNVYLGGKYKVKIELQDDNISPQTNIYYLEVEVKGAISNMIYFKTLINEIQTLIHYTNQSYNPFHILQRQLIRLSSP